MPEVAGDKTPKRKFKTYPIGYFHIDIAEVQTAEGTRRAGTVRGMHFQRAPFAEDKFVSVLAGEVLDVAVDLRGGSPTFLRWHAETLSATNRRSLFIPQGFAHGFQTLAPDCELIYLHTREYVPEAEGGLNPLDPRLAIEWPLPVSELSARDRDHAMLSPAFGGLTL